MLDKMIIDSFAGGGGASTGIEIALGRSPDVAINHNAAALALHAANHPVTLHLDSNIWDVTPLEVTKGRPVGLLWASPDCKHFSKAKGGAPRDRNIRDLAWVVVDWAETVKPDVICMENVEEFVTWGPIDDDGQPIKEFAGITFEAWIKRLKKAGYKVEWRDLRACDFGAPTIRNRWFLIARRDGLPIAWPKPTHGDPESAEVRKGKLKPWRTAAECIDWSLPCPSVFDTSEHIKATLGLRANRPLAVNTMARIARGLKRYVLDAQRPFIVNLTHGARVEAADEPFKTITGAHRGEKAVVAPYLSRTDMTSAVKRNGIYSLQDPLRTQMTSGSFVLTSPFLATMRNSQKPWQGADEPTHTITAGGAGLTLVAPSLLSMKGTARRSSEATLPHPTVLAGGCHSALVAPVLTYAQQGGGNRSMEAPHHTICASRKDQNAMFAASMIQVGYGERERQAPRALDLTAPLGTIVAGGAKHAPMAAFLARHFGQSVGHGADEPIGTVTAGGGGKSAPVAAFLAQQNNDSRRIGGVNPGRSAEAPLSTICQSGSHQTVTAAWFAKYYGTGDGSRTDDPCHTVTVKDRFAHMQADMVAPPFGPEHETRARQVADFMRAHDAWDDREFVSVEIGGATFIVVDIGMRMLTPRELFTAQGFPADYVIEGVWEGLDANAPTFREFSKEVQISCCGNSVCPPLAQAIVSANCQHLVRERRENVA